MEYTSELQVTHHHEHCRLVDSVLGNADRGREEEGGPQELTGLNLAAGSSSFTGLLCVVISAYLITRAFICCHTRCSRYNHLLPLALKLLWILSTSAF